jgi:hypothetical protein
MPCVVLFGLGACLIMTATSATISQATLACNRDRPWGPGMACPCAEVPCDTHTAALRVVQYMHTLCWSSTVGCMVHVHTLLQACRRLPGNGGIATTVLRHC